MVETAKIGGMVLYLFLFFMASIVIIPRIYRMQCNHGVYHAQNPIDRKGIPQGIRYETLSKKIFGLVRYYITIATLIVGLSLFLNSLGASLALGGLFGANWNQPGTILLLEAFLLIMFSVIRVVSLSEYSWRVLGEDQAYSLSKSLNGYLFSFLLTSYLLIMYQVGREITVGKFVFEVSSLPFSETLLILTAVVAIPLPVALLTELALFLTSVADEVKIYE